MAGELAGKRAAAAGAVAGRGDVEAHLAFQMFARDHLGRAEELERVAPGEIRPEVAKVVVGLRRVAEGETTAFQEKKVFLADARVQRYDASECGIGATPATP